MKKINIITLLYCLCLLFACKKEKAESYALTAGSRVSFKGFLENDYFNSGTIEVQGSGFTVRNERIGAGEIKIPLSTILITNQLTPAQKEQLTEHLQSDAFFNMLKYPNVIYSVKNAEKLSKTDAQGNNYLIQGDLMILGKSLPLNIPAKIELSATAFRVITTFKFDRTKWGMTYASDPGLPAGDKIKNEIEISLDVNATL